MQSTAKDVSSYLQEVPLDRQETLKKLRQLCLETLNGYEESMEYGVPGYKKNGVVEVGFASQKNYISLYILKQEVMDTHRELLKGVNCGKGCIRYSRPDKIDFDVVQKMLIGMYQSESEIC